MVLAHIFEADAIPSTLPEAGIVVLLTPETFRKRFPPHLQTGLRECLTQPDKCVCREYHGGSMREA